MAALSAFSVSAVAAEATSQSDQLAMEPSDARLGGWTPLVRRPHGRVRVVRTPADGDVLRISDGGRPAGYVMMGVQFAPRTSVVGQAEVNLARQVIGKRRARPVIEVAGNGVSWEAGLVRTRSGALRWGAWFKDRDGTRRALTVSPVRVKKREWTKVTLATRWNQSKGRASLRVNGRVVLRTKPINLSGRTASRVHVGLGNPDGRREVGLLYVRRALAWGPGLPLTAATPGGGPAGSGPAAGTAPRTGSAPRGGTVTPPRPGPEPAPPRTGPAPPPPPNGDIPGRLIHRVDFENGFAGTSSYQAVSRDRAAIVTSPVAQGSHAARFEVRQGDDPINSSGDRSEVSIDTLDTEGQERWYSWAVMFDQSFPNAGGGGWQVVTQFHSQRSGGQPPVAFYAENNVFRLQVWPKNGDGSSASGPKTIWSTPVQRNVWYRMQLHVKWSGRDDTGFVELFVNGQPAGQKTYIRTLYPGYRNYTKLGYYRSDNISQTGVVYIDDFRATQVSP
ncbi:MAG TPA: polysaccharide lyase [Miltoncostaeaceae bacterium]|nr:polysaccharide lyase [Miltoncostaeaceae bacterium]